MFTFGEDEDNGVVNETIRDNSFLIEFRVSWLGVVESIPHELSQIDDGFVTEDKSRGPQQASRYSREQNSNALSGRDVWTYSCRKIHPSAMCKISGEQ